MRVWGKLRVVGLVAVAATAICTAPTPAQALTVTKTADSDDKVCDADCSLREAIEKTPEGGIVTVPASAVPYEVTDALGTLIVQKDLTIAGAGARLTEVTAPGSFERPFSVRSEVLTVPDVTIRDLSITGGDGNGAGQAGQGGGVLAFKGNTAIGSPELILERVRVAGNKATVTGAAQSVGGGVDADGKGTHVLIRDSLVVGNQALGLAGGEATGGGVATFALASMTIENTTIAGNEARGSTSLNAAGKAGGVIVIDGSLVNVTIFGNTAKSEAGGKASVGGNLITAASVTVRNTVVGGGSAEAEGGADCVGAFASQGGNVLAPGCGPPSGGDRTPATFLLGPLADNGGPTDTMALLAGSPAIDAGVGCPPPAADQRSVPRPQGPACDSGAFELEQLSEPPPPPGDFFCRGRKATITGTNAKETLVGTKRADVIFARGGNDTIKARGGNDVVCAGTGKDVVKGGAGKDRIYAEKGADKLFGGPGRDTIVGGPGKDLLRGGPGKDVER